MDVGKPQRIYRVEPLKEPTREKTVPPAPARRRAPGERKKAPAR